MAGGKPPAISIVVVCDHMKSFVFAFGESKTISEWARDERCRVSRRGLSKRLTDGWDAEVAISTPICRNTRVGANRNKCYVGFGESKTVSEWVNDPRCEVGFSTLYGRLRRGVSIEEALVEKKLKQKIEVSKKISKQYEAFGVVGTVSELFNRDECVVDNIVTVFSRLNSGWSIQDALMIPVKASNLYEAFGESKTISEWVNDPRCAVSESTLRQRMKRMTFEDALSVGRKTAVLYEYNGESKTLDEWVNDPVCVAESSATLHSRIHKQNLSIHDALTSKVINGSVGERKLFDFVESLGIDVVHNDRKVLKGMELDVYVPSRSYAFEFNGLHWHSDLFRHKMYHYDKYISCRDTGVSLVQIWEDDWNLRQQVVKQMIINKLGLAEERIFARNCKVVKIDSVDVQRTFLDNHHLQGFVGNHTALGLIDDDNKLVALACFKRRKTDWELVRYATKYRVVGGFSKILKAFQAMFFGKIFTFADLTNSKGDMYSKNGFKVDGFIEPDYAYVVNGVRVHKFNYRKSRFKSDPNLVFDSDLTERELADLNGLRRIWDAGKLRFVL